MAHTGAEYDDPGADYYYTRRDPERTRLHAVNQLSRGLSRHSYSDRRFRL